MCDKQQGDLKLISSNVFSLAKRQGKKTCYQKNAFYLLCN